MFIVLCSDISLVLQTREISLHKTIHMISTGDPPLTCSCYKIRFVDRKCLRQFNITGGEHSTIQLCWQLTIHLKNKEIDWIYLLIILNSLVSWMLVSQLGVVTRHKVWRPSEHAWYIHCIYTDPCTRCDGPASTLGIYIVYIQIDVFIHKITDSNWILRVWLIHELFVMKIPC